MRRYRAAGEPDRVSDQLGHQQFRRVSRVDADSPAGIQKPPDVPTRPERGGRQRGERECSGVNWPWLARPTRRPGRAWRRRE